MQEVQQNKKAILVSNRSLAEQNLMLQPRLDHQKNELTKRYRCLQEQFEAFQLRKCTLGDVTPSFLTCSVSLVVHSPTVSVFISPLLTHAIRLGFFHLMLSLSQV